MTQSGDQLVVRSHVARDLLQNAALFRTDRLVVWEYVSNGLQYVDPGTSPSVWVTLDSKRKRILIVDNGRGMDWPGLQNFFVMHGENIDRVEGRPGRGRFGTGKSAAFGIAEMLRITSVRQGRRSKVELNRAEVARMRSGGEIPVRTIEREVQAAGPNGTTVEIEGIHLRSLDQLGIIHYIERHLLHWPKDCTVFVNNHECEFYEPPVAWERRFPVAGETQLRLGDVTLVLKVAKAPLEEDLRGVSIFSNGVWHETTLAGSEGRELSQYIFGEIEVPALDGDDSPIPPFDMSRSMRLNPANDLVQTLYGFMGQKIEEVRRELLSAEKERRASDEARKLLDQGREIAKVINQDFDDYRQRVARVKAKARGASDALTMEQPEGSDDAELIFGSELPAVVLAPACDSSTPGAGEGGQQANPSTFPPVVAGEAGDEKRGSPGKGTERTQRSGGGFGVRFNWLGPESHRAVYVREERAIYINLDHPQLAAALQLGTIDDPLFRRLAYEVAFSEYAIVLAREMAENDQFADHLEPIFEIRESLNRLARRAAALYSR